MRALITGASGFVGAWLTRRLLADGVEVAVLVRDNSDLWRLEDVLFKVRRIYSALNDIQNVDTEIASFAPDTVFHLAWSGGNSSAFNDDISQVYANVPGSLQLLRSAARAGASVFINLGSCTEYGRFQVPVREGDPTLPTSLYGAAKMAVEDLAIRMAKPLNLRVVSIRLFWLYGPGDDEARLIPALTRKLLANQRHAMTPGTQLWDYLYVEDAVDALVRLALEPAANGVFNLGSGRPRQLREVAQLIKQLTGSSSEIGFGELPFSPQQVMHLEADVTRLADATGWTPTTSLEEGLQRTVKWYAAGRHTLNDVS